MLAGLRSMDDALLVRGFERLGDLPRDRERLGHWHRPSLNAIRKRLAFHELENERAHGRGDSNVGVFDAVNRADVRMIERRQHARFAFEAGEAFGMRP